MLGLNKALVVGGGMAVEEALVLAQELERHPDEIEAALAAFTERRYERCRLVVETSVAIGAPLSCGGDVTWLA